VVLDRLITLPESKAEGQTRLRNTFNETLRNTFNEMWQAWESKRQDSFDSQLLSAITFSLKDDRREHFFFRIFTFPKSERRDEREKDTIAH
jgi:hypothetical protein